MLCYAPEGTTVTATTTKTCTPPAQTNPVRRQMKRAPCDYKPAIILPKVPHDSETHEFIKSFLTKNVDGKNVAYTHEAIGANSYKDRSGTEPVSKKYIAYWYVSHLSESKKAELWSGSSGSVSTLILILAAPVF